MKTENQESVGAMKKRRVLMADERRYLIYYTFDSPESASSNDQSKTEKSEKSPTIKGEK